MGYTRFNDDDWRGYSSTTKSKPAAAIFTSRGLHPDLNPLGVVVRESRDSDLNPESTAIIVDVDVTGSMGMLADYFIKEGLGELFKHIYDRKPVTDPHVMFMATGDAYYDQSPLQVSQFEADISIAKQLEKVHIEHGGGGNGFESYELPWYFAAFHTSIDCFEKRNKKGYLFTIGDEETPPCVKASQVARFIGASPEQDIDIKDMYETVSKMYNVYHIMVAEGQHCRGRNADKVRSDWTNLIGENAIWLTDHTKLSEVIESIIEVNEGRTVDSVTNSWSGDTSLVVKTAIQSLTPKTNSESSGIIRF
ncbi:MAG: hypothetical protein CTY12_01335 [Methylotenera sp.]|nr:MAG: hypothetical protein CTY12_01335 [Methylotenera sp.]